MFEKLRQWLWPQKPDQFLEERKALTAVALDATFGQYDDAHLREWIDAQTFSNQLFAISENATKCGLTVVLHNELDRNSLGTPLDFKHNGNADLIKIAGVFYLSQSIIASRCKDFAVERSRGAFTAVPKEIPTAVLIETKITIGKARELLLQNVAEKTTTPEQAELIMASFMMVTDTRSLLLSKEEALHIIRKQAEQARSHSNPA